MDRSCNSHDAASFNETPTPPNNIELRVATPNALHSCYLPVHEPNLFRGNLAYRRSDYTSAITLYTNVLEAVSQSSKTLPPAMIEAAGIALSNRAASKLHLEDHLGAALDLEKAIEASLILRSLTLDPNSLRVLVFRVFQLIKCYIVQLDLISARRTWLKVDEFSWREVNQDSSLREDAKKITSALNWLLAKEKTMERLRFEKKWNQVLSCIGAVEKQGGIWGFEWLVKLPLNWIRWKAEAKAWSGFPEEAELLAGECMDPISFDTPKDIWLRALIAYAYGDLKFAAEHLEKLYESTTGEIYASLARRLHHLTAQITEVMQIEKDDSQEGIFRMSTLIVHLLNHLDVNIERASRQEIRLIYIEMCATRALKLQEGPRADHCIGEVIRHVNHMLTAEITGADRTQDPLPIRLKDLFLRCLLAKARVCALRKATLLQSRKVYEEICRWFSRGWTSKRVAWLQVKGEYDAVSSESNFAMIKLQTQIQKKKLLMRRYEEALRISRTEFGYYRVLGVPLLASGREIKISFRKASLVHHPDKGGCTAHFQLLTEIQSTLLDRYKRESYDWYCKMSQVRRCRFG